MKMILTAVVAVVMLLTTAHEVRAENRWMIGAGATNIGAGLQVGWDNQTWAVTLLTTRGDGDYSVDVALPAQGHFFSGVDHYTGKEEKMITTLTLGRNIFFPGLFFNVGGSLINSHATGYMEDQLIYGDGTVQPYNRTATADVNDVVFTTGLSYRIHFRRHIVLMFGGQYMQRPETTTTLVPWNDIANFADGTSVPISGREELAKTVVDKAVPSQFDFFVGVGFWF